ncbi:MAG: hypothetical protein E6767_20390 [Dysgonomonas sp.]|nr:hypothetical protein [Dysgonomonas sp.]
MKEKTKNNIALLLISLLIICLFAGCKSKPVYIPLKEVHTVTQTLKDTVLDIRLIPYKDSVQTTDTLSYLENKYAFSWAKLSDNKLHHSLTIKDVDIPVNLQIVETLVSDSVPYPVYVKEIQEVNRLTSFQSFQIWCGRIALLMCGIWLAFKLWKKKQLL